MSSPAAEPKKSVDLRSYLGAAAADGTLTRIAIEDIEDNPKQPRTKIAKAELMDLVNSIPVDGLLQPVLLRPNPDAKKEGAKKYQAIAGHRRIAAYLHLASNPPAGKSADDYKRIPAIVRNEELTLGQMSSKALIENLHRVDLSAKETADGLRDLLEVEKEAFEASGESKTNFLAKRTGLHAKKVQRYLALSEAPTFIQEATSALGLHVPVKWNEKGEPTESTHFRMDHLAALEFKKLHEHLKEVAPKSADKQTRKALEEALRDAWPQRKVEAFVKAKIAGKSASKNVGKEPTEGEGAAAAVYRADARAYTDEDGRLVIHRARLAALPSPDKAQLRGLLEALLKELA